MPSETRTITFWRKPISVPRIIAALLLLLAAPAGAEYAPYFMVGSDPSPLTNSGLRAVTLAFLGTDGHCSVKWRGLKQQGQVAPLVQSLQQAGIKVILSFGGWLGADPAGHCATAEALQAVYQQMLDRYHVNSLDFDIEGPVVMDLKAHARRNQALIALKHANPDIEISFTLPVRPHGIPKGNGIEVLQSARDAGFTPDVVNLMTMDYFFDPAPSTMARHSFRAIDNAAGQLKELGLNSKLGVTPMIGQNDNRSEIFTLDDAKKLAAWLKTRPQVTRVAMWSVERDNGGCPGDATAQDKCSGVAQAPGAFSRIFVAP